MRLNRRIQFYKKPSTVTQDEYGQPDNTETLVGTGWARMVTTLGDEAIESGEIITTKKTKFTVRFRSDIMPITYSIHYDGDVFDIKSVREINKYGRKKYIEILAEARDNG